MRKYLIYFVELISRPMRFLSQWRAGFIVGLCLLAASWSRGEHPFVQTCENNLSATWEKGRLELLLPAHTWHNRWHYSHKQIESYNENPWGIGLAKTYEDAQHRHRLFVLTFQDSFNKPEPTFGYSWQLIWLAEHTVRPTLGVVAGFTLRENYHWIPLPAAIPIAGLDIGPLSLETTYLIGFDVLFSWVTWRF